MNMKPPLNKGIPVENLRGANLRQLVRETIKLHRLRNGDVVLIKTGTRLATTQTINALSETLGRLGFPRCLIATVDDFADLTTLDAAQMAELGWVRVVTEVTE
jgi:hypothetical protein